MYVKCVRSLCHRKAWLRPGQKQATCDGCKELAKWLRKVHGPTQAKRAPVRLTDAENAELRTLERITVKVGH